jgi:hypothetical protein
MFASGFAICWRLPDTRLGADGGAKILHQIRSSRSDMNSNRLPGRTLQPVIKFCGTSNDIAAGASHWHTLFRPAMNCGLRHAEEFSNGGPATEFGQFRLRVHGWPFSFAPQAYCCEPSLRPWRILLLCLCVAC